MVVTRSTADSTRGSTRLAASEDCDYDFTSRRRPTARANAGTRTARSSGSAAQLSRVLVPAQAKQRRARKRAKRKASKQAAGQVKKRQRSGLKPKAPQARRKRASSTALKEARQTRISGRKACPGLGQCPGAVPRRGPHRVEQNYAAVVCQSGCRVVRPTEHSGWPRQNRPGTGRGRVRKAWAEVLAQCGGAQGS